MINSEGEIVRSQYTDNPDAAVFENHRLILDITPVANVDYDETTHTFKRILPVSKDSEKIEYEFILLSEIEGSQELIIEEE